jgi:small subunit ribosomal protein S18
MAKKPTTNITRRRTTTTPSRFVLTNADELNYIDYKNIRLIRRYLSRYMRIEPRRRTGLTAKQQRDLAKALKRARYMALLPFTLS